MNRPYHPSWINTLYLSMDANFKLKQKDRGFMDPPLSNGLAYMISDATLRTHLAECVKKNLTSEVFKPLIDVTFVIDLHFLDQHVRVKFPCREPGPHQVFPRLFCNQCGRCGLCAAWLQTPERSC